MNTARNSSFELLRIILIIMVMVAHGNSWFIGMSSHSELEHFVKCSVQSLCTSSVNAFILISGWFGVRGGLGKIRDLLFMLLFCTIPLLIVALMLNRLPLSALASVDGIYVYVFGGNSYYFIVDYIALLIISPILNNGIKLINQKQFAKLLIAGYVLIALYDFVLRAPALGSEGGYSVLWFVYLYLLARYMRIYGMGIINRYHWPIFCTAVAVQSVLFFFGLIGLRFTNPFIIIEAVCLISIFKDWNFHSKAINYTAKCTLMAYLLHVQPILVPYIGQFLAAEYTSLGYWIYIFLVLALSIGVFLVSVPLNRLREIIYAWIICNNIYHKIQVIFKSC